jgi:DNA-binding beta-propeller fold protein YncE
MSASYSGVSLSSATNAVVVTASDGRTIQVTKAEIQAQNLKSLAEGDAFVGPLLTTRWNALGDVVPLDFYVHTFTLNPLDFSVLTIAQGTEPRAGWWVRR